MQRLSARITTASEDSAPGLTCQQGISCTRSGPSKRLVASWACSTGRGILPPPPNYRMSEERASTGVGGGEAIGRRVTPFEVGAMYWIPYADPRGSANEAHGELFLVHVTKTSEKDMSWTWLDGSSGNPTAECLYGLATRKGARAPTFFLQTGGRKRNAGRTGPRPWSGTGRR